MRHTFVGAYWMARKKSKPEQPKPQPKKTAKRAHKSPGKRDPWTPWGKWAKARRERIERRQREREERRLRRQQARRRRRMRRRVRIARGFVFLGLIVLAFAIAGVVFLVIGRPYPWDMIEDVVRAQKIGQALGDQQARWDSLGITHYTVEITYQKGATRCGPAVVEVGAGRILDQTERADTHWFPPEDCDALLDALLIGESYDWLTGQLDAFRPGRTYLYVEFDPDFGYPTRANGGVYESSLIYVSTDDPPGTRWDVTWRDLRPLDEE
jgi:hypothetical protein